MRILIILSVLFLAPLNAADFEFWPGTQYDPSIPTFEEVLGYAPGERISSHAGIGQYFEALAAAAPEQVVIREYARSWQGRRLIYVVIGKPERIADLDGVQAAMQSLADPRQTDSARAESLIADTPGVTWLSYSVHGNEISSSDAAMLTAYHLLAARGDDVVDTILAESVVVLDPLQNPDGRDRFVHAFVSAEGLEPSPNRYSAEHAEPWPSGRVNHYTFDLNRDWLPLTQPETRGRVRELLQWFPLVYVDLHEMGGDSTYYFAPEAVPYNPHIAADQRQNLFLFGRNNARWFDRYGIDYFTREEYDAFYPGYGASWPLFIGSIAMTYEQASARGLILRKRNGQLMSYRETVRNHFVTSVSTAEVVARNRQKLLQDFYDYRSSAIEAGRKSRVREYLISNQREPSQADKLAGLLVEHGAEVRRATAGFEACGKSYPAGSYAVSMAQPAHRMLRTFLDREVSMEAEFLAEQERRRKKDLPAEIYDVTAWSLPLMFNVEVDGCGREVSGSFEPAGPERIQPGTATGTDATVAYLVPWGTRAAGRFLAGALRGGLQVKSTNKPFTQDGRVYPSGTLILKVDANPDDLSAQVSELARSSGAEVIGVSDSWVDEGPHYGSENVVDVAAPRVALVWDPPSGTYSAGHTRFVLERQFGYPVTAIRGRSMSATALERFDVLILPDSGFWASYSDVLGKGQAIKQWVRNGGTLVILAGAMEWAAHPDVDLVAVRKEDAWRAEEKDEVPVDEDRGTVAGTRIESAEQRDEIIEADRESPDWVGGALVFATVDTEHWLGAGVADRLTVLAQGNDIYSPINRDDGTNVSSFAGADELLASGNLWDENRHQLAFKPFVIQQSSGRGQIIGFTQDPNYRAYLDGLNLIFLNAVFRGPAHTRVIR